MNYSLLWSLTFAFHAFTLHAAAYDAIPRWGQATAVINDAVFIHGGKTDQYNSYSYTSAPNTNDLLFLSLSTPFSASSPPWNLVASSANATTSQGPALSWHTLSAYNTSQILLFGGQPGPNSPTVNVDLADSAFTLDVYNRLSPVFIQESLLWAKQPVRRIHHSTATTITGLVCIIGGEKADGSNNGFSDHYVYDPDGPTFTQLPSDNGPPDIYGHVSIILSDGRLLVFGGYCQSQGRLIPFSTIWILDTTQSSLSWTSITLSSGSLPNPRRAFVAVLIGDGKILIQGGSDAVLQNDFEDGWILDTTQNPMTWTQVPALSQVGPRRDHFAISYGEQVIFGFGYSNNGPAPATLQIYDIPSSSFVPSYNPPAATATITQTLPAATGSGYPQTTGSGGSTVGNTVTTTRTVVHPTSTLGGGSVNPTGSVTPDANGSTSHTTAIAVGTSLGALAVLGIGLFIAWLIRRKHRQREFTALGGDDDAGDDEEVSPHMAGDIPVAGSSEKGSGRGSHKLTLGMLGTLPLIGGAISAVTKSRQARNIERRDMLADEDTRQFDNWWSDRQQDGTGGSSWSLMSMLTRRMRSREPSNLSAGGGSLNEKNPFADGASLLRDTETGYIGAAGLPGSRPRYRRDISYTSTRSGLSYTDPFADTYADDMRDASEIRLVSRDEPEFDPYEPDRPNARPIQALPTLRTVLPPELGGHVLSPLSERTSLNTLSHHDPSTSGSSHAHSSENAISPFGSSMSRLTSHTSAEGSRSPVTTSIIGASTPPHQPLRRSDSWWARFSRTNFLDRRASGSRRSMGGYDIRDPNPPPRLGAIEESAHSASPERTSPKSHRSGSGGQTQAASRKGSVVYGKHGKSMSSLRTADSEAIERMAGTMDVIQRIRTRSQRTTGSTSTTGGLSAMEHSETGGNAYGDFATYTSPVEMTNLEATSVPLPPSTKSSAKAPSPAITPPTIPSLRSSPPASSGASVASDASIKVARPPLGGAVSERIQAYERRMSQDTGELSPTNTKKREERLGRKSQHMSVDYGLVPRASLFIANPDHRSKPSGDS